MMRRGFLLLLVFGLAGCPQPEPIPPGPEPVLPVTEGLQTLGDSELFPETPGPDEGVRARRRMDIHQLSAALERATGGQQWTEEDGSVSLEALAATLGEPDHIEQTDRDLGPSMLFMKFLGDAARAVCEDMKDADLATPESERVLLRYVAPEDDLQSQQDRSKDELPRVFEGRGVLSFDRIEGREEFVHTLP